jgi:hypothetical protein
MAASRNDGAIRGMRLGRTFSAASLFLALTALFHAAVSGQQLGPPIPLLPKAPPASGGGVTSAPLAPPAPGWSAEVSPKGEPLPKDFWQGTPRALADTLLALLPDTRSYTLQELERRLLLSPGEAPSGPDAAGLYLPYLRARLLLRLGELAAVRAVVAATPETERRQLWRLAVAADVIDGRVDRACGTVRERVRNDKELFWQRALIACQALEGKISEASLGLQILAEERATPKGGLEIAVDALAHRPAPETITQLSQPDPLLLRVILASGRRLDPSLVHRLSPELALAVARDEKAPPATRLLAALRAARFGALRMQRLRALLLSEAGASPGDPASSPARGFAAISAASDTADRLTRVMAFARGLARSDRFTLGARVVAPTLREIPPNPSLAASALGAARLSLAVGDSAQAQRWVTLVPATERRMLRLLFHLAEVPSDAAESSDSDVAEIAHSVLSLALFAGLGKPVPPAAWVVLPPPSWTVTDRLAAPAASWLDLAEAAQAKRIGETVIAAIIVASFQGKLSTDPVVLYTVISSLERIGLESEARRLALEAALAAGL